MSQPISPAAHAAEPAVIPAQYFDSLSDAAIIRLPELCAVLGGISRVTIWRLRDRGLRPVKITSGITGWRVGDVRAYLAARASVPYESSEARNKAKRSVEVRRRRREADAEAARQLQSRSLALTQ